MLFYWLLCLNCNVKDWFQFFVTMEAGRANFHLKLSPENYHEKLAHEIRDDTRKPFLLFRPRAIQYVSEAIADAFFAFIHSRNLAPNDSSLDHRSKNCSTDAPENSIPKRAVARKKNITNHLPKWSKMIMLSQRWGWTR